MAFHLIHFRDLRRPAAIGLLAASLLVSLAACGGDTGASAPPAASATATPAADTGAAPAAATPAMDMTSEAADAPTMADAAPTTAAAGGAGATSAVEVKATLREWALDLSQTEVPAGPVHFVISNAGQMPHNFTIKGDSGVLGKTANFAAAQGAQSVDVTLSPGTYTVYCSLPGHADRGQKNTLVVK
jgi:plastocyanin